jgi:hypothetical protein
MEWYVIISFVVVILLLCIWKVILFINSCCEEIKKSENKRKIKNNYKENRLLLSGRRKEYEIALKTMQQDPDLVQVVKAFRDLACLFFKKSNLAETMIQKRVYNDMIRIIKKCKEENKQETFAAELEKKFTKDECIICRVSMESIESEELPTIIILLPCNHALHLDCLENQLVHSKVVKSKVEESKVVQCGICRAPIVLGINSENNNVVYRNSSIRGFDEQMIKYAAAVMNELVVIRAHDEKVKQDMIMCGVLDLLNEENELRTKYKDVIEDSRPSSRQLKHGDVCYPSLYRAIKILEDTSKLHDLENVIDSE